MNIFGISPPHVDDKIARCLKRNDVLDRELEEALENHKVQSRKTVKVSLDQVERSIDANVALKSIIDRIERSAVLKTAQGASDLVSGRTPHDGKHS